MDIIPPNNMAIEIPNLISDISCSFVTPDARKRLYGTMVVPINPITSNALESGMDGITESFKTRV